MTAPESNSAGMTAKAPAGLRWNDARKRMAQLENSAGKLSSTWFLGMSGLIAAAMMFVACALVRTQLRPPRARAGWYIDTEQQELWRYWDGVTWTNHSAPRDIA